MPVLFVSHGNPMNALADKPRTRRELAHPRRVAAPSQGDNLCVSAHWYVPGTPVTAMPRPRTIHDFGRLMIELFQVTYPAPGEPTLARRVQQLLAPLAVPLDEYGMGARSQCVVGARAANATRADVPVIELGIGKTKPSRRFHYDVGRSTRERCETKGILLLGSGKPGAQPARVCVGPARCGSLTIGRYVSRHGHSVGDRGRERSGARRATKRSVRNRAWRRRRRITTCRS